MTEYSETCCLCVALMQHLLNSVFFSLSVSFDLENNFFMQERKGKNMLNFMKLRDLFRRGQIL